MIHEPAPGVRRSQHGACMYMESGVPQNAVSRAKDQQAQSPERHWLLRSPMLPIYACTDVGQNEAPASRSTACALGEGFGVGSVEPYVEPFATDDPAHMDGRREGFPDACPDGAAPGAAALVMAPGTRACTSISNFDSTVAWRRFTSSKDS
eukprot:4884302-Prymnesium_polylepis.1